MIRHVPLFQRALAVALGGMSLVAQPHLSRADGAPSSAPAPSPGTPAPATAPSEIAASPRYGDDTPIAPAPQPPKFPFLQYGVAITAVFSTPGPFCKDPTLDCVLGSGGGIAARVGFRSTGPWYFGGAYEMTKQDATKLYLLAILQDLRGEVRYYFENGHDIVPFVTGGVGVAGYGDEWAVTTWGPSGYAAVGVEAQSWSGPIIGVSLGYRPVWLQEFTLASGGESRGPGLAQMISIDLMLEAREAL